MTSQTTERALENAVESTLLNSGWQKADVSGWDVENAIFPQQAIAFIKATQPNIWTKIASLHGADTESQVEQTLIRTLNDRGTLEVLRHGFRFSGQTLRVAFFKPATDLQPRHDGEIPRQPAHHHQAGPMPSPIGATPLTWYSPSTGFQ